MGRFAFDTSRGAVALRLREVAAQDKGAVTSSMLIDIVVGGLAAVLVAGYVVIGVVGGNVVPYTLFASGPVMTAIVGALLAKKTESLGADVAVVKAQTNGQLSAQFAAASDERQAIASNVVEATTAAAHGALLTPAPADTSSRTLLGTVLDQRKG